MAVTRSEFDEGTTWRPDQGQHPTTITGKLIEVRWIDGTYGEYPLLEIEQGDGVAWTVHAFRDVLRSEITSCAPEIGDAITISYGGKSEKGYYRYKVRRVDGHGGPVDWSRGAERIDLTTAPEPAGESIQDRAQVFGDEPNF